MSNPGDQPLYCKMGLKSPPPLDACYVGKKRTGNLCGFHPLWLAAWAEAEQIRALGDDQVYEDFLNGSLPGSGTEESRKRTRGARKNPPGSFKRSSWQTTYVENWENLDKELFCRRFRLSPAQFEQLLGKMREPYWHDKFFKRFGAPDASGRVSSDLSLLLLGVLRFVGRNVELDSLAEMTLISEETHRVFNDAFFRFGEIGCSTMRSSGLVKNVCTRSTCSIGSPN